MWAILRCHDLATVLAIAIGFHQLMNGGHSSDGARAVLCCMIAILVQASRAMFSDQRVEG
jgi:hypothetical protein